MPRLQCIVAHYSLTTVRFWRTEKRKKPSQLESTQHLTWESVWKESVTLKSLSVGFWLFCYEEYLDVLGFCLG